MARIKYYYDTETCKYERIKVSKWDVFLNFLGFFVLSLILSVGLVYLYGMVDDLPHVKQLRKENQELLTYYELLSSDLETSNQMLQVLRDREDNIYRTIFEAEPLPQTIWEGGVGGVERYKDILDNETEREDLILKTFQKIDKLKRQLYIQTKSYDDITNMAINKAEMLASIPSIRPVALNEKTRLVSGFGRRFHPILKKYRPHQGLDFSADPGTPIYASGDGSIKTAGRLGTLGNAVVIDHGYGYRTRYGHMLEVAVKKGQTVKRGDLIGYVGNTGLSRGPHLHYEVWKDDIAVDPVYYIYENVTEEEFHELIETASQENPSFD